MELQYASCMCTPSTDIDPACAAACSHLLTQASNIQVLSTLCCNKHLG